MQDEVEWEEPSGRGLRRDDSSVGLQQPTVHSNLP
jgi:hypothetical protein